MTENLGCQKLRCNGLMFCRIEWISGPLLHDLIASFERSLYLPDCLLSKRHLLNGSWCPRTVSNGQGERYSLPQELTDNLNRSPGQMGRFYQKWSNDDLHRGYDIRVFTVRCWITHIYVDIYIYHLYIYVYVYVCAFVDIYICIFMCICRYIYILCRLQLEFNK